jgi:hypothetical protein
MCFPGLVAPLAAGAAGAGTAAGVSAAAAAGFTGGATGLALGTGGAAAATAAASTLPAWLSVGNVLTAGSGILSAGAALQSGAAQQAAMNAQAEIYRQQAERTRQIGEIEAARYRANTARVAGTQRALLAGSGVDTSTGSALLVQGELAGEGEFNALSMENNTAANVSALKANEVMARASGRNARTASTYRAGTTLLSTAASFA